MSLLHTIEDDRPERALERLADDQLDHTADVARKAATKRLRAFCDTLAKGKRELMERYHPHLFSSDDNNQKQNPPT